MSETGLKRVAGGVQVCGHSQAEQQLRMASATVASSSKGLPCLANSIVELSELLDGSPVDLDEVSRIVLSDPSVASEVLRLGKSRLTGSDTVSLSITDSIVLLGIDGMRRLVGTSSVLPSEPEVVSKVHEICQHSRAAAFLSERIAIECGYPDPAAAYLSALLHDIGKIALAVADNDHASDPAEAYETHSTVGARLATEWELPLQVCEVIEHRQEPARALCDRPLVAIVAAADQWSDGLDVTRGHANDITSDAAAAILSRVLPDLDYKETARLASSWQAELFHWLNSQNL